MATGVQTWSQTAATNATADSNVNWAEGMAPSAVNDSARAVMASVAKWRDDNNCTIVTSGTTTAFTAVTNQVESALTAGYTIGVQFHATSDVNATLAVDGLTAKPLQLIPGTNVPYGAFQTGSLWHFTYSTTGTGQWVAQNAPNTTVNQLTAFGGSDLTFASTAFADGISVTQGTSGTWLVTLNFSYVNSSSVVNFNYKLYDGTTVFASGQANNSAAGFVYNTSVTGVITNPAGNIRAAFAVSTASGSKILFNASGLSKDYALTAVRIA